MESLFEANNIIEPKTTIDDEKIVLPPIGSYWTSYTPGRSIRITKVKIYTIYFDILKDDIRISKGLELLDDFLNNRTMIIMDEV